MAPLSDEENNYIRLALLLKGVSPRAVRTFFDKEFQPSNLHSTFSKNYKILHDLKLQKILNHDQWNLLFPINGLTNSNNFDVTLMICLIRNLTPVTPPLTGFDSLPTQGETTPGSDLARIKWYRNKLAHPNSYTIDTAYFNTAWEQITDAVGRLGGQMMKHECQELKVKILDQSNQEIMRELKQLQREIRELRDAMENRDLQWKENLERLQTSHNKLRRCKSCSDIKNQRKLTQDNIIVDLTGDEVKAEGGNRQIKVIDLTEDEYSKTKKRKREEEEDVIVIDNIININGEKVKDEGKNKQLNVIDLTKDDDLKTKKGKYEEETDVIFIDDAGEDNEATRRTTVYTNNLNAERGHINHGFADSGPFQAIPGDSWDTANEENEASNRNTVHTNHRNEDRGIRNPVFADIPEDSWDSIFTTTDITTSGFMMRPGIHVPINSYNPEKDLICKKNCLLKTLVLIILIGCISGVVVWIIQNEYFLGSNDTPNTIIDDLPYFPDKCENDISTATVGEQMCIPYTQKFTSYPSGIHVRQVSSQYLSALQSFAVNVSSDTFEQQNGGWIINFNSSRTDQQIRFMKGTATCDSIGIYEITIEYEDGNVTSSEFEIKLKDPQLQQSVTRINDSIHVHCEMIKTCMASSLALFVNNGESSRLVPDINVCSNNDKESGTTVSADAIIPASWFSGNMTISCVPLMTDPELAANLTSTTGIPVCQGTDCVPDCKNDPQVEVFYPHQDFCTQFYQCSNGKMVSHTCSLSTYWSPSECTCVHFNDEICNRDTNRFFKPLLSIEKCTNASLV